MTPALERIGRLATDARCRAYAPTLAIVMVLGWVATRPQTHREEEHLYVDFVAFYVGGRAVWEGDRAGLYDFDAQRTRQQRALNWHTDTLASPFLNPPFVALAFAPLAAFDYPVALALWWVLCALAAALALALLSRHLARGFVFHALCFWPLWASFAYGQNTSFSLLALTLFLLALRSGRDGWAGIALGAMVFKPHLAVGFGLVLLVAGRWRAVASAASVVIAVAALSFLALPEETRAFLDVVRDESQQLAVTDYPAWGEINALFAGRQLAGMHHPKAGMPLGAVFCAVLLGLLAKGSRMDWRPGSAAWDRRFAGIWVVALMTSIHLFEYDVALVLPAWALVLAQRPIDDATRGVTVLAFLACTVGPFLQLAQLQSLGHALPIVVIALLGWSLHITMVAPDVVGDAASGID